MPASIFKPPPIESNPKSANLSPEYILAVLATNLPNIALYSLISNFAPLFGEVVLIQTLPVGAAVASALFQFGTEVCGALAMAITL